MELRTGTGRDTGLPCKPAQRRTQVCLRSLHRTVCWYCWELARIRKRAVHGAAYVCVCVCVCACVYRISAAQLAAQAAARQERADPAAQRDMETLRRVMLLAHTAAQWERDQRPATDPEEFGEAEGDVSRDEGAEAEAAQGKGALSAEQAQWLYDELVKLGSLNLGLGTTM